MRTFLLSILIAISFIACRSRENISNQETITTITQKVESQDYTFMPITAMPMGGKSISLNYSYSLKVSKDTVEAYLPYYGRAYVAPSPTDEGGIKFLSTNFDYVISEKKKGMWNVKIETKDNRKNYKLMLSIGDGGYTTLVVQDNSRQSISFYGKIE